MAIAHRFGPGWNAFHGRDPTKELRNLLINGASASYGSRPDRIRYRTTNAKSVVAKIYNRIALDVATTQIIHGKIDADGNYQSDVTDGLNTCLTLSANIDQTGMFFIKDVVESMFDEGVVAIVPVDTTSDPTGDSEAYDIRSMRVGRICDWYPAAVRIDAYDEETGNHEMIILPKSSVAIVENPFYSVMNEPNSTLQRLLRTISRLDAFNDQNASGKLDLIIQLPYVIKSEQRQREAEKRRKDLEEQLNGSQLGVGYIDGTEKVVQLNRSLENNLWTQVKELTEQLFNELGLTQGIIDGTADEQTSINYFNHTIAPICSAICGEMTRKFLSKTAVSQGHRILYFRDPFQLVTLATLSDMADKFRRNSIMTSNEIRAKMHMKPSKAEDAETLRNPNLNQSTDSKDTGVDPTKQNDLPLDEINKEGGNEDEARL